MNIMGLGAAHHRQFILLIDFASVLIVFILKVVAFFPLQCVYLSGLAGVIGKFTAVICTGCCRGGGGGLSGTSVDMATWLCEP